MYLPPDQMTEKLTSILKSDKAQRKNNQTGLPVESYFGRESEQKYSKWKNWQNVKRKKVRLSHGSHRKKRG